ncbi:hypothetical protein GQX74_002996 [Glossina fuscipes]|nr:hypothetical protein GQX74_002996 [Glossina fuscipes]
MKLNLNKVMSTCLLSYKKARSSDPRGEVNSRVMEPPKSWTGLSQLSKTAVLRFGLNFLLKALRNQGNNETGFVFSLIASKDASSPNIHIGVVQVMLCYTCFFSNFFSSFAVVTRTTWKYWKRNLRINDSKREEKK